MARASEQEQWDISQSSLTVSTFHQYKYRRLRIMIFLLGFVGKNNETKIPDCYYTIPKFKCDIITIALFCSKFQVLMLHVKIHINFLVLFNNSTTLSSGIGHYFGKNYTPFFSAYNSKAKTRFNVHFNRRRTLS